MADDVFTSLRVPGELLERLREVAAANERTVSGEIRFLITRHVEEHERRQARQTEMAAA